MPPRAAADVPAPKAPGSTETFSVKGLQASTTYYFAIKAIDKGLNNSPLSNGPVSATTLDVERITTLAAGTTGSARVPLTWTAIDDGSTGVMTSYDLRYSTSPITDDATFDAATQVTGMPAPKMVGSAESFTVMYLNPSTTYYFAIKAVDAQRQPLAVVERRHGHHHRGSSESPIWPPVLRGRTRSR